MNSPPISGSGTGPGNIQDDSGSAAPSQDSGAFDPDTGGAPQGSGGAPSTCAEANGSVGCCGANGESYYCTSTSGSSVKSSTCTSGKVCGWNASKKYYACVSPPAGADPSGAEPIACGGSGSGPTDAGSPKDAGSADASTNDSAAKDSAVAAEAAVDSGDQAIDASFDTGTVNHTPKTCAQADDAVGCCGPNGEVYYCASGSSTVTTLTCTSGKTCGWEASKSYYTCQTGSTGADPSGTYPINCQ